MSHVNSLKEHYYDVPGIQAISEVNLSEIYNTNIFYPVFVMQMKKAHSEDVLNKGNATPKVRLKPTNS